MEYNIAYDLEVIEFLVRNGKVTKEEATHMRHYLQSLVV